MGRGPDLFDQIVESLEEAPKPVLKRGKGRPKSDKTLKAEQKKKEEEFLASYESITPSRPEPERMIRALAQPDDKILQALEDVMTARQLAFCREYVVDFNATQAAVRAGYSPATADAAGHQLRQYRAVRKLSELYVQSQTQQITTVDKDYIIQKVTEIVTTAAKDSDKLRGLELLARHLGMFVDRTEITGKDGDAIRIEETKKEADEVARTLRSMAKKTAFAVVPGGKD